MLGKAPKEKQTLGVFADTLKFVLKRVLANGSMARWCYDQNFAVIRLWALGADAVWWHLGMGNLQTLAFTLPPS